MNCLNREQLFACAHHLLEQREEAAVQAHVEACERCRAALAEEQQIDALLDEWKPAEPSPWFDARVRQAVASSQQVGFFGAGWRRWAAAGALAILVGVGVWAWRRAPRPAETNPPVAREVVPQQNPAQTPPTVAQAQSAARRVPNADSQAKRLAPQPGDELNPDDDLKALEDYDLIANFDVLSEIPRGGTKVDN